MRKNYFYALRRLTAGLVASALLCMTGCAAAPFPGIYVNVGTNENNVPAEEFKEVKINYEFATKEEGIELERSNEQYYDNMNQYDLDFRLKKQCDISEGHEEMKEFAAKQVIEFTDDEKTLISGCMQTIEDTINENKYDIPVPENIYFIRTTMKDEEGATGYTHKTQIYLGSETIDDCKEYKDNPNYIKYIEVVLWHELFHSLTRNDKDFKRKIYSLIGATVLDEEIPMPDEVKNKILSNPDVDVFDSFIPLTIDGKKKFCVVVPCFAKEFEQEEDNIFNSTEPMLYPINSDGELYSVDDATDFWDVFGENTDYIIAIEETLADNFAYAMAYDEEKWDEFGFKTPELLADIKDVLRK